MRKLIIAITLGILAILIAFAHKFPQNPQTADPTSVARARAVIQELPLPQPAKDAYYKRLTRTPEAHLPYLVEEARRAVNFPMDAKACKHVRNQQTQS
jgi:hypothetical protein